MIGDYLKSKPLTLGASDEELKRLLEQSQLKRPVSWKDQIISGYNVPEPITPEPVNDQYATPIHELWAQIEADKRKNLEADQQRQKRIVMQNKLADVLSGLGTILIGKPQQQTSQGTANAFGNYEQTLKNLNALPGEGKNLQLKLALDKYNQDLQNSYLQQQYENRLKLGDQEYAQKQALEDARFQNDLRLLQEQGASKKELEEFLVGSGKYQPKTSNKNAPTVAMRNQESYQQVSDDLGNKGAISQAYWLDVINKIIDDKNAPDNDRGLATLGLRLGKQVPTPQLQLLVDKYWKKYGYELKDGKVVPKKNSGIEGFNDFKRK